ncbi:ATP-binding cassette domain-containing protein [Epidermidibacterium keratini]|uniref:ATP-binding cassette domain-containing protein n=1 Tax=Epidermidibacterium keratini TaxID=1891644 RepID=A0A7L4YKU9_9ACTN|nr:ATP-binding cassette domain-containing protein [Epidermidibacterium keratini]QHB99687.1 ATP-binding cassette domain-containing protein [Epidermidibacterium keratini]
MSVQSTVTQDVGSARTTFERGDVVLRAEGLSKRFVTKRNFIGRPVDHVHAVDDVSIELRHGETLALVGESGSGKSSTARLLVQLEVPDAGRVEVFGEDWVSLSRSELRSRRRRMQMVFQDPFASLNPMKMVVYAVGEPLMVHDGLRGAALDRKVLSLLDQVGLPSSALHRYPYEFSGGQRQRIAIARALAADPEIVIADEAVSALDVSTQAQILNLLRDIQHDRGLSFLFITHDLGVVRQVADRISVMFRGKVVEEGTADEVFTHPREAYTRRLLSAVPEVSPTARERRRTTLESDA